jgi:hypothetical protein
VTVKVLLAGFYPSPYLTVHCRIFAEKGKIPMGTRAGNNLNGSRVLEDIEIGLPVSNLPAERSPNGPTKSPRILNLATSLDTIAMKSFIVGK